MAYLIDLGGRGKITKKAALVTIDGNRRKVQLGRVPADAGRRICDKIGELEALRVVNSSPRGDLAEWVAGLAEPIKERLIELGLVPQAAGADKVTLGKMLEDVFQGLQVEESTKVTYGQTRASLEACLGSDVLARGVSSRDAERYRRHLVDEGLAPATIAKRIKTARSFFRVAMLWKMVSENPFDGIKAGGQANSERMAFIEAEDIARVVEQAPSTEWKALILLARFGGLRCPSEHFELKWGDIDWKAKRMLVRSPKTKGKKGREYRIVPLFPEVEQVLEQLYLEAPEGAEHVFSTLRRPGANLRTHFERLIERAGLKAWPRLFQNLRSSRATELAAALPGHVAAAMLGHTEAVARGHYLQIRESDFEAALAIRSPALGVQNRVPAGGDKACQGVSATSGEKAHLPEKQQGAHLVAPCRKLQVTPRGFEHPSETGAKLEEAAPWGTRQGTSRGEMELLEAAWPSLPPAIRERILELAGVRAPERQSAKGEGVAP
jgi:integrase